MFSLNNGLGHVLETVVVVCTMIYFRSWPEAVRKIKKMVEKASFWQISQCNSYINRTMAKKVSYEYTAPREVQFISYRSLFNPLAPELFFFNFSTPCI